MRALYGIKSAGTAIRNHLADCMRVLGYKSFLADHDLLYKAAVDLDGDKYYSYILCYVDDILVVHNDAMPIMKKINKFFLLKTDSNCDLNIYLGAKIKYHKTPNGMWSWTMSPSKYVCESCKNCKDHVNNNFDGKYKLPKQAPNPFVMGYEAELDTSTLCNPEEASYFQSIIRVMRWMIEIGRVDIATEVSMLSSLLAMPRVGHLEAAINIMGYLRLNHNSRLFLDPTYSVLDHSSFNDGAEWAEFYGDATKAILLNMPEPRGGRY